MQVKKDELPCANKIGKATHLSDNDIKQINTLYQVPGFRLYML